MKINQEKINLLRHYAKLIDFNFNRFKGNNYSLMTKYFAHILMTEVEEFMPLWRKKVLDVGGARGEFCQVLNEERNCDATNLDPHPRDCVWPKTIIAFGDNIPIDNNEFDFVICREVLEHIPREKQQQTINEIYRVTKGGGLSYIAIPPWYSPHAGHHLKPFHILPFRWAKYLREIFSDYTIVGHSFAEEGLYPITFKRMLDMIRKSGFRIIATKDTHFRLHFLTKIPLIREFCVPTAVFILRKESS